jgi:hypothetical protein
VELVAVVIGEAVIGEVVAPVRIGIPVRVVFKVVVEVEVILEAIVGRFLAFWDRTRWVGHPLRNPVLERWHLGLHARRVGTALHSPADDTSQLRRPALTLDH